VVKIPDDAAVRHLCRFACIHVCLWVGTWACCFKTVYCQAHNREKFFGSFPCHWNTLWFNFCSMLIICCICGLHVMVSLSLHVVR